MKTTMNYFLLAMAVLSLTLTSCEKEGPQGPAGPAGTAGVDGTNGTNGTDGVDGNANVMSSDWFTPASYTLTTSFGRNMLEHVETAAEITAETLDNDVILVYAKLNGYAASVWPTDHVAIMPITLINGNEIDTWTPILAPGNLTIRFTNNNNSYTTINTNYSFRYVIIPASTTGKSNQVDFSNMSYEEVMDHFGLDY